MHRVQQGSGPLCDPQLLASDVRAGASLPVPSPSRSFPVNGQISWEQGIFHPSRCPLLSGEESERHGPGAGGERAGAPEQVGEGRQARDSAWPRRTGSRSITMMAPSLIDQSQDDS